MPLKKQKKIGKKIEQPVRRTVKQTAKGTEKSVRGVVNQVIHQMVKDATGGVVDTADEGGPREFAGQHNFVPHELSSRIIAMCRYCGVTRDDCKDLKSCPGTR